MIVNCLMNGNAMARSNADRKVMILILNHFKKLEFSKVTAQYLLRNSDLQSFN